eukprot:scaffold37761_cov49-Attheya_sp.AAC.5
MKLKRSLARQLATITLRGKFCLYSQWFPGCENDVADSCSPCAREDAVTGPTSASNKLRAWSRWVQFLDSIELNDDDFLKDFDWGAQQVILGAFAQTVREAEYSTAAFSQLASATVKATVDYVAHTFDDNFKADPRRNSTGQTSRLLSMQYRGYKNQDPSAVQQKAITCSLLRQVGTNTSTIKDLAASQLANGAFFFAMRSCEYLTVTAKDEDRRTKRLRIKNIRFFRRHKELSHNDPRLASSADSVTITFEYQKNDERNDSVTMHRTGDMVFCPVISWATIVQRVLSYPGTDEESPCIDMRIRLCAAASILGIAKLGFNPEDIGTHSLRYGHVLGRRASLHAPS